MVGNNPDKIRIGIKAISSYSTNDMVKDSQILGSKMMNKEKKKQRKINLESEMKTVDRDSEGEGEGEGRQRLKYHDEDEEIGDQ